MGPSPNHGGRRVIIGIPYELKQDEHRVAMTPAGAHALVMDGHQVLVEAGAGAGSQISDLEYEKAGATIVAAAEEVWSRSDMVCKVKEPQVAEFAYLRDDLLLFTYLHLAAYPHVAEALTEAGTTSIAYETVQLPDGSLPLLAPMSEVAGRMGAQVGARFLEKFAGGRGVLMGGVPGVAPANVVVIGAGSAGTNAAQIASGMGADVTIFDLKPSRLVEVDRQFRGRIKTQMSNPLDLRNAVVHADLVIGAVLLPGARAPRLVSTEDVSEMLPGSVLVDISIDQGGCFETSHETTHSDPTYVIDDVVHYAVGNIPGAVPRTSTFALTNVTLRYVRAVAARGVGVAVERLPELGPGINTRNGEVVNRVVAASLSA